MFVSSRAYKSTEGYQQVPSRPTNSMPAKAQVSSHRPNMHVLLAAGECKEELRASSIAMFMCYVSMIRRRRSGRCYCTSTVAPRLMGRP